MEAEEAQRKAQAVGRKQRPDLAWTLLAAAAERSEARAPSVEP